MRFSIITSHVLHVVTKMEMYFSGSCVINNFHKPSFSLFLVFYINIPIWSSG